LQLGCRAPLITYVRFVKRAYRLRRPDQFQRVRREGRSWTTSLLVLNSAPSRRRQTRCGFVVAKRVGNAVIRNRAKRRTREAVRLILMHIIPGHDLIFVIRNADVATVPFTGLQAAVEYLVRQAGLWRDITVSH